MLYAQHLLSINVHCAEPGPKPKEIRGPFSGTRVYQLFEKPESELFRCPQMFVVLLGSYRFKNITERQFELDFVSVKRIRVSVKMIRYRLCYPISKKTFRANEFIASKRNRNVHYISCAHYPYP